MTVSVAITVAWSAFGGLLVLSVLRAALTERACSQPPWSRPVRGLRLVRPAIAVAVAVLLAALGTVVLLGAPGV